MNIYGIPDAMPAIEQMGYTMDAPERMKLQMGLTRLTSIADADQLLFWGKIFTNNEPYYVALGVDFKGYYGFPHKKFYYSSSNLIFDELPPLDEFNKLKVNDFTNQPFTGDPNTILININGEEGQQNKEPVLNQEQNPDSDQEQIVKIVPKNYTELDRLSYTVRAIENQCQLTPIGAYKISTQHEIRYNQSFKGLGNQCSLSDFQHFRYPKSEQKKQKIEDCKSVLIFDFLDPVDNCSHWTIQQNTDQQFVTVRNFTWIGYLAYHRLKTKLFGGIYFGSGIKKTDISFYV